MPKLNPALKTRKLSSLPSDLQSIAEEVIIAKFGDEAIVKRKEKKVRKSTNSFPGDAFYGVRIDKEFGLRMGLISDEKADERFTGITTATEALLTASRHEPGVDRRIDFHSRSSYFVTQITRADTRAFRDAIQRLDYENAPRRARRASVSPEFARELMSHPDFPYYAGFRDDRYRGYNYGSYVGELFGVPIFATPGVHPEIIAQ